MRIRIYTFIFGLVFGAICAMIIFNNIQGLNNRTKGTLIQYAKIQYRCLASSKSNELSGLVLFNAKGYEKGDDEEFDNLFKCLDNWLELTIQEFDKIDTKRELLELYELKTQRLGNLISVLTGGAPHNFVDAKRIVFFPKEVSDMSEYWPTIEDSKNIIRVKAINIIVVMLNVSMQDAAFALEHGETAFNRGFSFFCE